MMSVCMLSMGRKKRQKHYRPYRAKIEIKKQILECLARRKMRISYLIFEVGINSAQAKQQLSTLTKDNHVKKDDQGFYYLTDSGVKYYETMCGRLIK